MQNCEFSTFTKAKLSLLPSAWCLCVWYRQTWSEVYTLICKVSFACVYVACVKSWYCFSLVIQKKSYFTILKEVQNKAFRVVILSALLLLIIFQYHAWIKLGFFTLTEKMWALLASIWRSSCNFWTLSCFLCKYKAL